MQDSFKIQNGYKMELKYQFDIRQINEYMLTGYMRKDMFSQKACKVKIITSYNDLIMR